MANVPATSSTAGALLSLGVAAGAAAVATLLLSDRPQSQPLSNSSQTHHIIDSDESDPMAIRIGLAHVLAPVHSHNRDEPSDRMKNTVTLELAIQEVEETLYVYIDDDDKHRAIEYTSELYNLTWDIACLLDKTHLDIIIVSCASASWSWEELQMLPELDAIYGLLHPTGTKVLNRGSLLPVVYRSPDIELVDRFITGNCFVGSPTGPTHHHDTVIVNGTFDHLHNGHKRLLWYALSCCKRKLVVGITASPDVLATKPFAEFIEPLDTRKANVLAYIKSVRSSIDVVFIDVMDKLGPVASWPDGAAMAMISHTDVKNYKLANRFSQTGVFAQIAERSDRSGLSSSRIRAQLAAAHNGNTTR